MYQSRVVNIWSRFRGLSITWLSVLSRRWVLFCMRTFSQSKSEEKDASWTCRSLSLIWTSWKLSVFAVLAEFFRFSPSISYLLLSHSDAQIIQTKTADRNAIERCQPFPRSGSFPEMNPDEFKTPLWCIHRATSPHGKTGQRLYAFSDNYDETPTIVVLQSKMTAVKS